MKEEDIKNIARELSIQYGTNIIKLRGSCNGKKYWKQKNDLKIKSYYDGMMKVLELLKNKEE